MANISLESKLVGNIEGEFIVEAYQRGYRWKEEVTMLLNDINDIEVGKNYCLQPIVVKKLADKKYELIDGQQRLTTLSIIIKYIKEFLPKSQSKFFIDYVTRPKSRAFLDAIDFNRTEFETQIIDEYFLHEATRIIVDWFASQDDENQTAIDFNTKLNKYISVIWYEIDDSEDAVSLFTRLNIGRIPLTNAELVKALFLSRNNGIDNTKQMEIATEWDIIEKELRNKRFWGFITNKKASDYPTRIELIFDLMANKRDGDRDKLFTFFHFDDVIKNTPNKADIWTDIIRYYQQLKEWYEDINLYHKIGYLIASNSSTTQELIQLCKSKNSEGKYLTKNEFKNKLNSLIATSINFTKEYCDLRYDNKNDYPQIEKLLLLFNVETIRQKANETMFFPFDEHKNEDWSLEHIHAQQSEGLNKNEQRYEWLSLHRKSLENIDCSTDSTLKQEIEDTINNDTINGEYFSVLFNRVVALLSKDNSMEYTHSLANMALLGFTANAALNNSTFDVKRNKILEKDKTSDYIPVCTRRVFLKYYTPSESNQLYFWGEADRDGYMQAMNEVLKEYLQLNNKEIKL